MTCVLFSVGARKWCSCCPESWELVHLVQHRCPWESDYVPNQGKDFERLFKKVHSFSTSNMYRERIIDLYCYLKNRVTLLIWRRRTVRLTLWYRRGSRLSPTHWTRDLSSLAQLSMMATLKGQKFFLYFCNMVWSNNVQFPIWNVWTCKKCQTDYCVECNSLYD